VSENASGFGNELQINADGSLNAEVSWTKYELGDSLVGSCIVSADTNVHQMASQAVLAPTDITYDASGVGLVQIYRDNGTNMIAQLQPGERQTFYVSNVNLLYYKFTVHAGTENFYWCSTPDI